MTQPGEFYQRKRSVHPTVLTPDYKTSVARRLFVRRPNQRVPICLDNVGVTG